MSQKEESLTWWWHAAEASHEDAHRRSNRVDVIAITAGSFVFPDVMTELSTIEETIGRCNT